eukprot:gb/GECG01008869.1/.p1 GENE.gb/GECG01008869.1/~~gb/GECG01008869.1/.p1  ORF type:complete len:118 (+),score=13.32 gb/GECG01008869.1/:1-354(+)
MVRRQLLLGEHLGMLESCICCNVDNECLIFQHRNPYYKNDKKTIEPHLLAKFEEDFYGEELRLVVTEYLRGEANFSSLEDLIGTIHEDIRRTEELLRQEKHLNCRTHSFLVGPSATS